MLGIWKTSLRENLVIEKQELGVCLCGVLTVPEDHLSCHPWAKSSGPSQFTLKISQLQTPPALRMLWQQSNCSVPMFYPSPLSGIFILLLSVSFILRPA